MNFTRAPLRAAPCSRVDHAHRISAGAGLATGSDAIGVSRLGLAAKSASEARSFVGGYGAARLALRINRMSNRRGLVADKLLFGATLAGAGLRRVGIHAVFGRPGPPSIRQIQAADDLRAMLNELEDLPLFGKPLMGQREGGEIAIFGYDDQTDEILTVDGDCVSLPGFWTMLQDHQCAGGWD